jgi:hypothetical protein
MDILLTTPEPSGNEAEILTTGMETGQENNRVLVVRWSEVDCYLQVNNEGRELELGCRIGRAKARVTCRRWSLIAPFIKLL